MDGRLRVALQGIAGAYSHMACNETFPDAEPVFCSIFEDCFQAVSDGRADAALIPVENSTAGRVADIHSLLPTSGLHITGEVFSPVHHCLLAPAGATIKDLRSAASHTQALSQCRLFLAKHGIQPRLASDTAGAARMVGKEGDPTRAAVASRLAAELYALDVLAEDIEDGPGNTTRFLVLRAQADEPDPDDDQAVITSLVFRVRNIPAALYKALGGFATNRVNMLKLESFMLDQSFQSTEFYCDIEGHPGDANVALALEELGFFSRRVQILGVYPASPYRRG